MDQVLCVLRKICNEIGTPQAHAVMALAEQGEWAQIQDLKLAPPYTYASPAAYREDNLVVEFVRKLELPDRSAAASRLANTMASFWEAEHQCHRTNGYMLHLRDGFLEGNDVRVVDFINRWRRIIADLLGPLPQALNPAFSPGSTLSDTGKTITIPDKMSSHPTCYSHSMSVALHCVQGTELDKPYRPKVERANRFFTVPKDSKKYRGCCVEASLNVSLQLAVGSVLKERYSKYYKVDFSTLNTRHKMISQEISRTGSHSTIDLSNASDTVARELVRALLPNDWLALLESLRATHTVIERRHVRLEKFSSMGNGFTFELETILFRTLIECLGSERDESSCFGDDIIVPSRISDATLAALQRFGFTPNKRKTFCEGPFRESCGGDYFLGHDVRAVYLKKPPDEPQRWMVLHNQLLRWGGSSRLRSARWFCVDQVPLDWRVFGPPDLGDIVFHREMEEPRPLGVKHAKRRSFKERGYAPGTLGYWVKRPVHRKIVLSHVWFAPRVVIAAALKGVSEQISLRDSVTGYVDDFVVAYGLSDKNTSRRYPLLGIRVS